MIKRKIKVLIVDDSAVVRRILSEVLSSDPEIEVIGTAMDPYFAAEIMSTELPDVLTLDIEMPRMDGLTFLKKIMSQHPVPVVICSSLSRAGTGSALKAMEYGAVEVISKPRLNNQLASEETKIIICDAVKAACRVALKKYTPSLGLKVAPKYSADVILPGGTPEPMLETTAKITVIGASTGGTEALREILVGMPTDCHGIVIVQHMPEVFTRSFAMRLDEQCRIKVKEAEQGDTVLRGHALIAPGNKHLLVMRSGARFYTEIREGPLVNRHRPSVDVLFRSAARCAGKNALGALLTGMGDDGARGLLELKEAGAVTLAQDEATSVVYGMPKEAVRLGAVQKVLPLEGITRFITHYSHRG